VIEVIRLLDGIGHAVPLAENHFLTRTTLCGIEWRKARLLPLRDDADVPDEGEVDCMECITRMPNAR